MPHLLSASQKAKLASHKRALDHFYKNQKLFQTFAKDMLFWSRAYPKLNDGSRVALVAALILQLDDSIWGLDVPWLGAQELAEIYAREVVGHEAGSTQ